MDWIKSKKLILASQSPRRKELLAQAGFEFEIRIANIDEENYPSELKLEDLPAYLAEAKASKISDNQLDMNSLVLAADSLVFYKGEVYSKPTDRLDACRILNALSGRTHTVITGICLKGEGFTDIASVYTEVTFDTIHQMEIEYYVDHYLPYDKAGAYGIQDWLGLCKVKSINGSYSNIMGLPMETIYPMLKLRMDTEKY